jgi:hypothetical protein
MGEYRVECETAQLALILNKISDFGHFPFAVIGSPYSVWHFRRGSISLVLGPERRASE